MFSHLVIAIIIEPIKASRGQAVLKFKCIIYIPNISHFAWLAVCAYFLANIAFLK